MVCPLFCDIWYVPYFAYFVDWGNLIGDIPTAGAILDRLLQSAQIIPFKGKSYRLRNERTTELSELVDKTENECN